MVNLTINSKKHHRGEERNLHLILSQQGWLAHQEHNASTQESTEKRDLYSSQINQYHSIKKKSYDVMNNYNTHKALVTETKVPIPG